MYLHVQQVFSPGQRIQLRIGATLNAHRTSSECSSPLSVAMRTSPAPTPPPPTTSYSPLVVAAVGRLDQQFGAVSTCICDQAALFTSSSSASASAAAASSGIVSSAFSSTCSFASAFSGSGSGRPSSAGAGAGVGAGAELCSGFPPGAILQWPPKSPVQSPIQSPSRAHQSAAAAASSQHQLFRRSLLASKRKSELHVFQYR